MRAKAARMEEVPNAPTHQTKMESAGNPENGREILGHIGLKKMQCCFDIKHGEHAPLVAIFQRPNMDNWTSNFVSYHI